MEMHYLIAERGTPVKYYVDRHELGLFDMDVTLTMMRQAGLDAEYLPDGLMTNRGLFIGIKESGNPVCMRA